MTDGHSLIYHSSTTPMAVISKGDFVQRGFCPSYGGDFVHLLKFMRGIMSIYQTWWEASQWHRDSELLKSLHSDIHDSYHGGHLENFQTAAPSKPEVRLSWNLVGGIVAIWRFRIAKIVLFRPNRMSDWAETWWDASQLHRDSELLKSFCSKIQDGIMVAILKFFKWHLPNYKLDWAKTWWEASQWFRDSELLKLFRSDIQDVHHGGHLEILQTTSPPKP